MDIVDFSTIGATEETTHRLCITVRDGLMQIQNGFGITPAIEMPRERMLGCPYGNPLLNTAITIGQIDILHNLVIGISTCAIVGLLGE